MHTCATGQATYHYLSGKVLQRASTALSPLELCQVPRQVPRPLGPLLRGPGDTFHLSPRAPVVAGVQDLSHVDRWGPPAESLGSTGSPIDG